MRTGLNLQFWSALGALTTLGPNSQGIVTQDPWNFGPGQGVYWWIPFISLFSTDANGQALSLFLLPPPGQNVQGSFTTHPIPSATFPPSAIMVAPTNAFGSEFLNMRSGVGGYHCNPIYWRETIVIPSLWQLALLEQNGVYSGVSHQCGMQFFYQEIPNDQPCPELS